MWPTNAASARSRGRITSTCSGAAVTTQAVSPSTCDGMPHGEHGAGGELQQQLGAVGRPHAPPYPPPLVGGHGQLDRARRFRVGVVGEAPDADLARGALGLTHGASGPQKRK